MRPKEAPRRGQDAPRRSQDAPRRPQDGPKMHPRRPKTPPRCPKTPPGGSKDAPKTPARPPQDAPETPQGRKTPPRRPRDAPRRPQDAPKTPQEVPRSSPRRTKIHPKLLGDFLKLFRNKKRFCDPTAHEQQHARAILDRFEKDFRTLLGCCLKLFLHKKDVFRNETRTKQETKWKRNGNETEQKASKKKSALPVPCRVRF